MTGKAHSVFTWRENKLYSFSGVPKNLSNYWAGDYSITYESGGPPLAKLISPTSAQTLSSNSSITFYLNFVTRSNYTVLINVSPVSSGTVVLNPSGGTYTPGTTVTFNCNAYTWLSFFELVWWYNRHR